MALRWIPNWKSDFNVTRDVTQGERIYDAKINCCPNLSFGGFAGCNRKFTRRRSFGCPKVPQGWKFTFPDGDPKAGKTVFMNMQCYSCHAIQLPRESLAPPAGRVGPDLTGYFALPKEYLAESIIKAPTRVAAPGYTVKAGKAAMGNYQSLQKYLLFCSSWCSVYLCQGKQQR